MKYIYQTQEFLKKVYENGGYFCTFSKIYQVNYSQAQNQYTCQVIARKLKNHIGYAKRGYVNGITAEMVERFTGNKVLEGV